MKLKLFHNSDDDIITIAVKSSLPTDGYLWWRPTSKHYHSLKYVPCGLNWSLFEVFSLSLGSCFSCQGL